MNADIDVIECDQCDGGSLDSLDYEEIERGIRDTCYRCNGSGLVNRERDSSEKRHHKLYGVARFLSSSSFESCEQVYVEVLSMVEKDQELLIAWLAQNEHDAMIRDESARNLEREKARLAHSRDLFRRKSYCHLSPDPIPF